MSDSGDLWGTRHHVPLRPVPSADLRWLYDTPRAAGAVQLLARQDSAGLRSVWASR